MKKVLCAILLVFAICGCEQKIANNPKINFKIVDTKYQFPYPMKALITEIEIKDTTSGVEFWIYDERNKKTGEKNPIFTGYAKKVTE